MYTAIIADDENKICQLIKKLGEWDRLGIEIIEICNHGRSAIEAIQKFNPDICITDIRMPIHDGLEIIEMAKKLNVDTTFIIVSGYRHFEYAHSAVKLGAIDYLLKPIDKVQLNNVLEKACQIINDKRKQLNQLEQLDVMKEDHAKYLTEKLWHAILHNKQLPDNVNDLNDLYGKSFIQKEFYGIHIKTNLSALHAEASLFGEQVCEISDEVFDGDNIITYYDLNGIRLLIQPMFTKGVTEKINLLFLRVKNLTEVYGKFDLIIGYGSEVTKASDIPITCAEALTAYKTHLAQYSDTIINYSKISSFRECQSILLDNIFAKKLSNILETLNINDIASSMKEFEQHMIKAQNCNPSFIDGQYHDLLELITSILSIDNKDNWISAIEYQFDYCRNHSEICEIILKEMLQVMEKVEKEKKQQLNKPIRDVQQYILMNYRKQLSLIDLGAVVNLNPIYLSKLFKQQAGQGIVDYIAEVRVAEAKKLLSGTNKTVAIVASEIGFEDEKYFSKIFKKVIGISPSEYRKLHI